MIKVSVSPREADSARNWEMGGVLEGKVVTIAGAGRKLSLHGTARA